MDSTPKAGDHLCTQQITENRRGKACCIGVDEEKKRGRRKNSSTCLYERMYGVLNFPYFSLGAAAVRGGVHDNCVVGVSPAGFPLHKFHTVIDDPADWSIFQAAGFRVFPGPGHHALGCVYMSDSRSCLGCGQSSAAGISKQIQNLYRPACLPDQAPEPVPVGGLLREKARMLEAASLEE